MLADALTTATASALRFGTAQCVLSLILGTLLFIWFRTRKNLPPGPYGLPLVGYLPFLGDDPSSHLKELSKKYGNIISVRLGTSLTVILNDYEAMKTVLSHPSTLDRAEIFDFLKNLGFGMRSGEEWVEQRRICLQLMKELSIGSSEWENYVLEDAQNLIDKIRSFNGTPFEIEHYLQRFINNNVMSLIIGRSLKEDSEEERLCLEYCEIALFEVLPTGYLTQVPGIRHLSELLGVSDSKIKKEIVDRFLEFFRKEIATHQKTPELKNVKNFINLYLETMERINAQKRTNYYSVENLVGNLSVLFLGSADTVPASLIWLFHLSVKYPEMQNRIHKELDEVMAGGRRITYDERAKIPYTMSFIIEMMRYSSLVPISSTRRALYDFQVNGYTIPKGAHVSANMRAIHHDPNYWDEPEKFKPERFLQDDGKKVKPTAENFVPFSYGRRNCPGERIAWMEIVGIFALILHRFEMSAPSGEYLDLSVNKGLLYKLKPKRLIFKERLK